MKSLKNILLIALLLSVSITATPLNRVKIDNKIYQTLKGTTINQFQKKGLSVDLTYKSEHVDIDEISNVDINLSTPLQNGLLKVNIKSLDNTLSGIDQDYIEFQVTPTEQSFPLHFQVSAQRAGVHYINLTLSMEKEGARVLVVPVNIGSISNKLSHKRIQKNERGVNISISQAEETIE